MTAPTACVEYTLLLQADLDGELDAAASAALAAHVADCAGCAALRDRLAEQSRQLRGALQRHPAPARLRAALEARMTQAAAPPPPTGFRRARLFAGGGFAAGAVVAAMALLLLRPPAPGPSGFLLASHLRALQPGHLMDVISTDQHTVKPWFDGRIGFSPPVEDFAAKGFPLLGGRLDYLGTRQVAVLVYGHAKHVIDVYVWPDPASIPPATIEADGYRITSWTRDGFRFQAVTDADLAAAEAFAALWQMTGPTRPSR